MNKRQLFLILNLLFSCMVLTIPKVSAPPTASPSIIQTLSDAVSGFAATNGRNIFYANGLYWAFFFRSTATGVYCTTSTNGTTWSGAAVVDSVVNSGADFDVWVNETDNTFHIATCRESAANYVYYRKGNLNANGTITWVAAKQTIHRAQALHYPANPFITVDSNGHPWVTVKDFLTASNDHWIFKSNRTDGVWMNDTANSFPYTMSSGAATAQLICYQEMTNGKVYVMNSSATTGGAEIWGRMWDGSSFWSDTIITTDTITQPPSYFIIGDDIHMVYQQNATWDIMYTWRENATDTWATPAMIVNATTSNAAPIIRKRDNDTWVMFWMDNKIAYYKIYRLGTWLPTETLYTGETKDILPSTNDMLLTSEQENMLVSWQSKSPYIIYSYELGVTLEESIMIVGEGTFISDVTLTPDRLDYTVNGANGETTVSKVHVDTYGEPITVAGASSWSYNETTEIITVTATHSSPVSISVYWTLTPGDEPLLEPEATTDLLYIYLLDGDLFGFVTAVYTSKIGMAFYGILILIVSGVFYNRTKSLAFLSIIWLLLGGTFIAVTWIFSPIAVILLALGLTGIIYQLVEKESS